MRVGRCDTFTECHGFAGAHGRHELQQAGRGIGNAGLQYLLIALVRQAHRKDRVALRQDCRVQLGRPLRDDAQRNTVFAAFLGDLGDRPLCRLKARRLVDRHVAVRFFAHKR